MDLFRNTTQVGKIIISELIAAHQNAAINNVNSISTATLLNAYAGSGNVTQSIAAALLTIGSKHAPLTETRKAMQKMVSDARSVAEPVWIAGRTRYLGLGNSFFKDRVDPSFQWVYTRLQEHWMAEGRHNFLDAYSGNVAKVVKARLYPNAAGITAAVCIEFMLPPLSEIEIFTEGRISGWLSLLRKFNSVN